MRMRDEYRNCNNQEAFMSKTIEFGKRIVPVEQIALVEPFDPETQKNMRSHRPFKSRIVLLNRDSILSETEFLAFAEEHGFRVLTKDGAATNPEVPFSVERFEATADFQPSKPFVSRLMWKDGDGNTQSKLMLSEPEDLIAIAVRGEVPKLEGPEQPNGSAINRRSRRRRAAAGAAHEPQPQG
jgi:hypothetical protein